MNNQHESNNNKPLSLEDLLSIILPSTKESYIGSKSKVDDKKSQSKNTPVTQKTDDNLMYTFISPSRDIPLIYDSKKEEIDSDGYKYHLSVVLPGLESLEIKTQYTYLLLTGTYKLFDVSSPFVIKFKSSIDNDLNLSQDDISTSYDKGILTLSICVKNKKPYSKFVYNF